MGRGTNQYFCCSTAHPVMAARERRSLWAHLDEQPRLGVGSRAPGDGMPARETPNGARRTPEGGVPRRRVLFEPISVFDPVDTKRHSGSIVAFGGPHGPWCPSRRRWGPSSGAPGTPGRRPCTAAAASAAGVSRGETTRGGVGRDAQGAPRSVEGWRGRGVDRGPGLEGGDVSEPLIYNRSIFVSDTRERIRDSFLRSD